MSQGITNGFGNIDGSAVARAAAYGIVTGAAVGSGAGIVSLATRLVAQTAIGAAAGATARVTENVVTDRPAGEGVALAAVAGGGSTLTGGIVGAAVTGTAMAEAASSLHYVPSPAGPLSVPAAVVSGQVASTVVKVENGVAQSQNQHTNDRSAACTRKPGEC